MKFNTRWAHFHPVFSSNPEEVPSLTQQHFKDSCDINCIVARSVKTGFLVDPLTVDSSRKPIFGDFTSPRDYEHFVTQHNAMTDYYFRLPSDIREISNNDPVVFEHMLRDSQFTDYLTKRGLIAPDVAPTPPDPVKDADPKAASKTVEPKAPKASDAKSSAPADDGTA